MRNPICVQAYVKKIQGAVTSQSKEAGACYRLVSLPKDGEEDDPDEEVTLV